MKAASLVSLALLLFQLAQGSPHLNRRQLERAVRHQLSRRDQSTKTVVLPASRKGNTHHHLAATSSPHEHGSDSTPTAALLLNSPLMTIEVSRCGPNGATQNVTATTGPNGSIEWLNCGISDAGGWNPPYITISDIIVADLPSAIKVSHSPFAPCSDYVWAFEKYGTQFGIPSILLAALAMEESSCNANTIGGGGEQGLMQLSEDKCKDAPEGNCLDIAYNIRMGAEYFLSLLSSNRQDLLLSIGEYNGWRKGLTVNEATAAAKSSCCTCQQNLDYIFQYLNGWVLNINAYGTHPRLGEYFNLDVC